MTEIITKKREAHDVHEEDLPKNVFAILVSFAIIVITYVADKTR